MMGSGKQLLCSLVRSQYVVHHESIGHNGTDVDTTLGMGNTAW